MPVGLFVMIGLSVVTYRRCRAANRRALIWVPMVWVAGFLLTTVVAEVAIEIAHRSSPQGITEREAMDVAYWPGALGMVSGAGAVAWLAGRNSRKQLRETHPDST